jgi:cation diffusion facilitator family transporter
MTDVVTTDTCCEVREVAQNQRRVLTIVLVVNLVMFVAEATAGLVAHSTALLADSVDMLGDAIVYGFSLYVIQRGAVWQARAAMLKGVVMAAFGAGVLAQVGWKIVAGVGPDAHVMTVVGLAALGANLACLALLWRRRDDDINMRSAWLCSRNDVIGNTGVLIAAVAVAATGSAWPDLLVGMAVAVLFLRSAIRVMGEAARAVAPA